MATKPTKPDVPNTGEASPKRPRSPAASMQAHSIAPPEPAKLSITLRADTGYEYHLDLPREVIDKLLDPDVPDAFIEVPAKASGGQQIIGTRRYLHTSYIKEIDVRGLD